jgi:hypothetical protein
MKRLISSKISGFGGGGGNSAPNSTNPSHTHTRPSVTGSGSGGRPGTSGGVGTSGFASTQSYSNGGAMTQNSSTEQEIKYFEKLNIPILSIAKIKHLIKTDVKNTIKAWDAGVEVDRQAMHIIGPAGVGKTQICFQIAEELEKEIGVPFEIIMVKAPVLSRDDFVVPYPVLDKENRMTGTFQMLYSDFVPRQEGSFGLFVIDEFSRGDSTLQQLLWQIQNEYAVHRHKFPKGWFVISNDNPDDAEYQMETMEDAAGLRRQLHVYTEVSAVDFLNYAIETKFHRHIIEFIQAFPDYLYDSRAQKLGSVYANPASYEKLSDHLKKFESNGGISSHYQELEWLAGGLLNTSKARLFLEFVRDKSIINPRDVFFDFQRVKPQVQKLIAENDNSKLAQLMHGFTTFMITSMPKYNDREVENVHEFLLMMPSDTAATFISQVGGYDRKSKEFRYMTGIHNILMRQSDEYKRKFYDPMVTIGRS